jgi:hypothetical protein
MKTIYSVKLRCNFEVIVTWRTHCFICYFDHTQLIFCMNEESQKQIKIIPMLRGVMAPGPRIEHGFRHDDLHNTAIFRKMIKSSRGSSVRIVTVLRAGWLGFDSLQGLGIFLPATASTSALRPTQSPIQWAPGTLSPGVKRQGVKLTTHLHVIPRIRLRGAKTSIPHTSSWRGT